jgi:hypothetical protein
MLERVVMVYPQSWRFKDRRPGDNNRSVSFSPPKLIRTPTGAFQFAMIGDALRPNHPITVRCEFVNDDGRRITTKARGHFQAF